MRALARLLVGLWTGAVAAVAFLVAPRAFRFLDDNRRAGDLLVWIFRRVDLFGIAAGAVAVVAWRRSRWRAAIAVAMTWAAACNAFFLGPRIAARAEPFAFYHRASEGLWGAILLGGVALLLFDPAARSGAERNGGTGRRGDAEA